jgi:hypothetical protein
MWGLELQRGLIYILADLVNYFYFNHDTMHSFCHFVKIILVIQQLVYL